VNNKRLATTLLMTLSMAHPACALENTNFESSDDWKEALEILITMSVQSPEIAMEPTYQELLLDVYTAAARGGRALTQEKALEPAQHTVSHGVRPTTSE
jgi:hypothetical protein